jgi:hypothetical protein
VKLPEDFITYSEHLRAVGLASSTSSTFSSSSSSSTEDACTRAISHAASNGISQPATTPELNPYTVGTSLPSTHFSSKQEMTSNQGTTQYYVGNPIPVPLSVTQQSRCASTEITQEDHDKVRSLLEEEIRSSTPVSTFHLDTDEQPSPRKRKRARLVVPTAAGQRSQRKDIYGFTGGKR